MSDEPYYSTEQCPHCKRQCDGLNGRYACTCCDTTWDSNDPTSITRAGLGHHDD